MQKTKIETFFKHHPPQGYLTEWGTPIGQMGRLVPTMVIRKMKTPCLWITDDKEYQIYPSYWKDLGFDLKNIFFLYEKSPFKNLRIPLKSSEFNLLVFDLKGFVSPSNMNYLSLYCRQNKTTCLLLRNYFLSPKNGNPFSRYRFNCSYSLRQNEVRLNSVKGTRQSLKLRLEDLVHG